VGSKTAMTTISLGRTLEGACCRADMRHLYQRLYIAA
jgi:hypothetical protein